MKIQNLKFKKIKGTVGLIFLRKLSVLGVALVFGFVFMVVTKQDVRAGIGISPAEILNENVKPGSSFEKVFTLSQSEASEPLIVEIVPDLGEANDWLTFEPSQKFTIDAGVQRYEFKVIVDVPQDAPIQPFDGVLRIKTYSETEAIAGGVAVIKGARVDVDLVTTNIDFVDLTVRKIDVPDVADGSALSTILTVENAGNIDAAPDKVVFEVQNLDRTSLFTTESTAVPTTPPNETSDVTVTFPNNDLDEGEYFAIVSVFINGEKAIEQENVFRVLSALESDAAVSDDDAAGGGLFGTSENLDIIVSVLAIILFGGIFFFVYKRVEKRNHDHLDAREHLILQLEFVGAFILLSALFVVVFIIL